MLKLRTYLGIGIAIGMLLWMPVSIVSDIPPPIAVPRPLVALPLLIVVLLFTEWTVAEHRRTNHSGTDPEVESIHEAYVNDEITELELEKRLESALDDTDGDTGTVEDTGRGTAADTYDEFPDLSDYPEGTIMRTTRNGQYIVSTPSDANSEDGPTTVSADGQNSQIRTSTGMEELAYDMGASRVEIREFPDRATVIVAAIGLSPRTRAELREVYAERSPSATKVLVVREVPWDDEADTDSLDEEPSVLIRGRPSVNTDDRA